MSLNSVGRRYSVLIIFNRLRTNLIVPYPGDNEVLIRNYNPVPNSQTIFVTTLQELTDAITTLNGLGGGEVILSDREVFAFGTGPGLTLNGGIKVSGYGTKITRIDGTLFTLNGNNNILEGLNVEFTATTNTTSGFVINGNNNVIQECSIRVIALEIGEVFNVLGNENLILNNRTNDSATNGVVVLGGNQNNVLENTFNTEFGVSVANITNGNLVSCNTFNMNDETALLLTGTNNWFINNVINDGVVLLNGGNRCVVSNNSITNAVSTGMTVTNFTNSLIIGNTIFDRGLGFTGIRFTGDVSQTLVSNNSVLSYNFPIDLGATTVLNNLVIQDNFLTPSVSGNFSFVPTAVPTSTSNFKLENNANSQVELTLTAGGVQPAIDISGYEDRYVIVINSGAVTTQVVNLLNEVPNANVGRRINFEFRIDNGLLGSDIVLLVNSTSFSGLALTGSSGSVGYAILTWTGEQWALDNALNN